MGLFVSVLMPYSTLAPAERERPCIGLVADGEALSAALVRATFGEVDAARVGAALIEVGSRRSSG